LLVGLRSHLQLNENVTIAPIVHCCLHRLVETDSDGAEVNIVWLNLNDSIAALANDLQGVLLNEGGLKAADLTGSASSILMHQARARIVEADRVFNVIVNVSSVYRHIDMIVFLLQSGESSGNLALLVRKQERLRRCKLDLIPVLFRHLPFILKRNPRFILHKHLLLAGDSLVNRRKE
jgi:hypothetical protein